MDLGLKGLNAIVTGGSKGIGRRAADIFADEGANVSICARNLAEVNETATSLAAKGVKSVGRSVNVGDKSSLDNWVKESARALGGIDIVVANVSALAVEDNEQAWKDGFEVDMMHTVRVVNAALPYLEKSKHGCHRDCVIRLRPRSRLYRPRLWRLQGSPCALFSASGLPACFKEHTGQLGVARQHLFQGRCMGAHREQYP